jgi:hypothetical protein
VRILDERPVVRRNSIIYRVALDDGAAFAAKFCLDPVTRLPRPADAAQQHHALGQVYQRLPASGRYRVPQPLGLYAPAGLILVEWLQGTQLSQLFKNAPTLSSRTPVMESAAQWLRAFHDSNVLGYERFEAQTRLDDLSLALENIEKPRFISSALSVLHSTVKEAEQPLWPRSWVHGDYKLENLLLDGANVACLDIQLDFENIVLYDLATFLNRMPELGWWGRSKSAKRPLELAFLKAYFTSSDQRFLLPVTWLSLSIAAYSWLDVRSESSGLKRLYHMFHARTKVKRLTRELASQAVA